MPSSEAELKRALGAFKKRLKLIRLDDDSRLGHGPLSGGRREEGVSLQPPAGFRRARATLAALLPCPRRGSRSLHREDLFMPSTLEVGQKLVSLCREGRNLDAIDSLYAP